MDNHTLAFVQNIEEGKGYCGKVPNSTLNEGLMQCITDNVPPFIKKDFRLGSGLGRTTWGFP